MDGSGCDRGADRQTETDQEKQRGEGWLEMIQRGVVGWVGAGLVARQNFEGCISISLLVDSHIVYLTEHVAGRNQYINAVFMPVSVCT